MATGTPQQIIATICPALYANAGLDDYVAMASNSCSAAFFGASWARAVALRACHDFTLDQRLMGEAGAITGKREGALSLSFSGGNPAGGDLEQTNYGVRLKQLIRLGAPGVSVGYSAINQVDPYLVDDTMEKLK